jgi:pantetheine-phosphate adenylyltransferase
VTIAFYPGSFDPITNGHIDVLKGALDVVDHVVIGVGVHPKKVPFLSSRLRLELIQQTLETLDIKNRVTTLTFDTLVIDAARQAKAKVLIRGVRDSTDLNYEMQMAGMNTFLAPEVQTIFIPAGLSTRHITATLVRQIAQLGGDVSAFVPDYVKQSMDKTIQNSGENP